MRKGLVALIIVATLLCWSGTSPKGNAVALGAEVGGYGGMYGGGQVGGHGGWESWSCTANDQVPLWLAIWNRHEDLYGEIRAEWLLLTGTVGGVQLPIFVLTSGGQIFDVRDVSDFNAVTYRFDHHSDQVMFATLTPSSLGMGPGDTFMYGYAYTTTSDFSKFVCDNIVTLNIK